MNLPKNEGGGGGEGRISTVSFWYHEKMDHEMNNYSENRFSQKIVSKMP